MRLEPLVADGLMIEDRGKYLALAVPLGVYSPPAVVIDALYEKLGRSGRRPRRLTPEQFSAPTEGRSEERCFLSA